MTADEADVAALPHPEAAEDVSALVVAIEKYAVTDGGPSDIPGSAQAAARFVEQLVTTGACRPSRITFVVSYDEDDYRADAGRAQLSPASWLARFRDDAAFTGINIIEHAERDSDFTDWITSNQYGPRPEDKHFVLFWIGHAQAGLEDENEKVYLFCSDASENQPRNVELLYLVRTVTTHAPSVEVSGFIHACQRTATPKAQEVLYRQSWTIDIGGQPGGKGPLRRASLLYASAYGETTAMAGPDGAVFADAVVMWLEEPGNPSRDVILTADSASLDDYLKTRGFFPYQKRYSPQGRDIPTPRDESIVSAAEWEKLIRLASAIDDDHATTGQVRWGAYCHAVGLVNADLKSSNLQTVVDLFVAVRDLAPDNRPAPLLVACDFVAYLSDPAQLSLAVWCEAWADARRADGKRVLDAIKDARPGHVEGRPYVSIAVLRPPPKPSPPTPGRRTRGYGAYDLLPLLFLSTYPELQEVHGPVDWVHILDESGDIIRDALASPFAGSDRMLVEFVLPPGMLGWWLEYEKPHDLGDKHPVVIRDLKRAWFTAVDRRLQQRHELGRSQATEQVIWLTCDLGQRITMSTIGDAAESAFCIVLERPDDDDTARGRGDVPAVPTGLVKALDTGALTVISVQAGNKCGSCLSRQSPGAEDGGESCHMLAVRDMLTRHLSDTAMWPSGLDDLPFILRRMRDEIAKENERNRLIGVKVSVLMQEPGRLWAGYSKLASGYLSDKKLSDLN